MKQMFGNCFQQLHNTRIEKKTGMALRDQCRSEPL